MRLLHKTLGEAVAPPQARPQRGSGSLLFTTAAPFATQLPSTPPARFKANQRSRKDTREAVGSRQGASAANEGAQAHAREGGTTSKKGEGEEGQPT